MITFGQYLNSNIPTLLVSLLCLSVPHSWSPCTCQKQFLQWTLMKVEESGRVYASLGTSSVLKSGLVWSFCLFWRNQTETGLFDLRTIGNCNCNCTQLVACGCMVGCNWLQSVALQTGPRLLSTSCNWWYLQVCLHFWDYLLTTDCFVVVHSHIDQTIGSSQHSAASLESHKPTSRSTSSLCFVCSKFVY